MRTAGAPLGSMGWGGAADMARHLAADSGSFLFRAKHPEEASFGDGLQTNAILADLYDLIAGFAYMFACAHSKSKPNKPERYPRPWDRKRIGRGAIPISDFDQWYYGGE